MIDGKTKLICLLGHPVGHSFSPNIHNFLFKKYNLNYKYMCFDVNPEKLEDSVSGIKALKIFGANITVPHKVNILKYLDEISFNAKLIGAVNTIKNENGKLVGYNTDGIGFVNSILEKGYKIKGKNIMILGAGGGARSIAVEIANSRAKSIEIRNRSLEKANNICGLIKDNFDIETNTGDLNIGQKDLESIDILINTTSLGMNPNINSSVIDENIKINNDMLVCDIVYNPRETKFLKWAKYNNLETLGGIDMLINQAIEAFYIWTGIKADKKELESIL
ncbi:shikimate dehydrogenase [Tepidibacter formicigenes]|jgi:shikimate dehydrogenase|uniref:Shikimate dehydrogenase (NADP(+)) n=1 Tax=Tepidibacter formicigenes DSM 15518 TaxID=1123349 RepID=A0A1M6KY30_9FIRM|nr:shikimate dehydrogenase [Tepidibacter formicigenes]SHJ63784.1 shikimate dehydrogenase [Tepidibacter formicigenes DSM 15518]